jgi:DeoR family deoxyribose operon repressor
VEKKIERLNNIIHTLRASNIVRIKELAIKLKVSEMTIRRDLNILAGANVLTLVPGGAIIRSDGISWDQKKYYLDSEESIRIDEKNRIGKKAASLIKQKDIVIIDSGSTTERLLSYIPDDLEITLICYSMNILLQIYNKNLPNLIFAGGYFHRDTAMFESAVGVQLINENRANKAFISAGGISEKLGITTPFRYEVKTKRAAIETSQTKILIVDSSKFGKIEGAYFAELNEFDVIITDRAVESYYADLIRDTGIELHLV